MAWNVEVPLGTCSGCRVSPPHFLAECRKKRLNQGSFVSLHFALFAFSGLCLVCTCIVCIFNFVMSYVLHFKEQPMWMALYGLIVLLRIYSLTRRSMSDKSADSCATVECRHWFRVTDGGGLGNSRVCWVSNSTCKVIGILSLRSQLFSVVILLWCLCEKSDKTTSYKLLLRYVQCELH